MPTFGSGIRPITCSTLQLVVWNWSWTAVGWSLILIFE